MKRLWKIGAIVATIVASLTTLLQLQGWPADCVIALLAWVIHDKS